MPREPATDAASLLDNLATAVVCLDSELKLLSLNPAAEALFGVSARQVAGLPVTRGLPALAPERARLRQALALNAAYTERELRLAQPGGEAITVDCAMTPFVRAGSAALLLEFGARDRQLRISRDGQLRAQNRANREMLRGLAHEIKNPLGGLRGAAQLLAREVADARLHEYTAVIIREADRLRNLVDAMLGPRQPPRFAPMNLHQALEHVRSLLAAELPPGVVVTRDYDPSIPELIGDREQLIQLFLNLAGNAAQALGAAGSIVLRTRAQRLFTIAGVQHRLVARVDVADDGPGIDPDFLAQVFLPMVTSRPDGSGMGLPIAQTLAQLHGGLIECESAPGATVFSVFLPLPGGERHG